MKALDGRHRWEVTERKGSSVTHTCRVCGVSQTFETLVPGSFLNEIIAAALSPNPYRALFGR